jgi:hypothetical protein
LAEFSASLIARQALLLLFSVIRFPLEDGYKKRESEDGNTESGSYETASSLP